MTQKTLTYKIYSPKKFLLDFIKSLTEIYDRFFKQQHHNIGVENKKGYNDLDNEAFNEAQELFLLEIKRQITDRIRYQRNALMQIEMNGSKVQIFLN